jgi:hypothetical protein
MCLVIHKPRDAQIPEALLASAAAFNPDGFGILSFDRSRGIELRRRSRTNAAELLRLYRERQSFECVLHLRYRTRGAISLDNTQPLRIANDLYMVHNGTIDLNLHSPGRSDTRHLIEDYLRPILRRRPELIYDAAFERLIRAWTGDHNRFVFMDARRGSTVVINRESGVTWSGLWLSNARWFDATRFDGLRASTGPTSARRDLAFLT